MQGFQIKTAPALSGAGGGGAGGAGGGAGAGAGAGAGGAGVREVHPDATHPHTAFPQDSVGLPPPVLRLRALLVEKYKTLTQGAYILLGEAPSDVARRRGQAAQAPRHALAESCCNGCNGCNGGPAPTAANATGAPHAAEGGAASVFVLLC
jgi:hypothetical protein